MTDDARQGGLDRRQLQDRAVRGALWTGIHTMVSLPIAFGVNIILARTLGPEGYGRLAYLTTVVTIATVVASLGVSTALVQFGSKEHAMGRTSRVNRLLSGTQAFRLLITAPLITLTVLAVVRVDPWLMAIAIVFGVITPAFLGGAQAALTIENRTDRAAQLTMIENIIVQAGVVVTILTIGTADSVWAARVVLTGILLTLPLLIISPQYRLAVLRPRSMRVLPRGFWRFALPTGVAGILGALTSNRIEVVFLDWFSDPVAMGIFGLAFGLAGHVYAPAQALVGPLVPAISGLSQVEGTAVRNAFLRTSRVAGSVGGILVATILAPLATLVPIIYGEAFARASDHVVALGIASGITLIGSPHSAFLLARLGGSRILLISIVTLLVNIGLALALIPVVGAWGATICCAAAMIVRALLITLGEAKALDVPALELSRSLGGMLAGVLVATLVWSVVRDLDNSRLWVALVACLAGATLFVSVIRVARTGITSEDMDAVSKSLPAPVRRAARFGLRWIAHCD